MTPPKTQSHTARLARVRIARRLHPCVLAFAAAFCILHFSFFISGAAAQPAPLVAPDAAPAPPGPAAASELDARRALDLGLPFIAAQIYQQLLDTTITPATPVARNRIVLALATALIQDDLDDEAAQTLQQFTGAPTPAFQLRQAMLDARVPRTDAAYATRIAAARAAATALHPADLTPDDKSWLLFLRGFLAEQSRDYTGAGALYQQATAAATSDIQRAWFELARQRARLLLGQATEANLSSLRQTLERNPGRPAGYAAASQIAVALNTLGRPAEATAFLQTQLQRLAPQETTTRDGWQLLLGMIATPEDDAGRAALRDLLANSTDLNKQRAALRLLAASALRQNRTAEYHSLLDQLIASNPPHPIIGSLLLFRAQLALSQKPIPDYLSAENDANRYLTDYPGAKQRPNALGILTAIAWEQGRYRAAASQATAARDALPDAPENNPARAQLNLLIAESYYRARDYRNASDAYAYALTQPLPAGIAPGLLMFQNVLSEMQAGDPSAALPAAQKLLDQYAADPRFDTINRWQAEWHLARALQSDGQTAQAYARVNHLLAEKPEEEKTETPPTTGNLQPSGFQAFSPLLRTRMAWLQARLAYDTGDYARTITLAEKLLPALGDTDPNHELSATLLLLEAQASLALNLANQTTPTSASDILRKLRADYPQTPAAIQSYIVEADAAAKRGQVNEAETLLTKLADDYKTDATYAPYALYQAALYAERRGKQEQYLLEAYNLLERLVDNPDYKDSPFIFYARLRQGNLLRNLNDYGAALNLYTALVNNYKFPQFPDALLAELALADTNRALVSTDASREESAAAIYERLYDLDRPDVPADLRIEAGYKFGLSLLKREDTARLETIWGQMISQFLLDDARAAKLGTNGRYWISRTLLDLGAVLERQNKIPQARDLYALLISKDLPGAALAQARLSTAGGK